MDKIPEYDSSIPIGLMIGGNCPQATTPMEVIEDQDGGPFAKRTRLGWCIVGPIATDTNVNKIKCHHTRVIPVTDVVTGAVNTHHFTVPEKIQGTTISGVLKDMYNKPAGKDPPLTDRRIEG